MTDTVSAGLLLASGHIRCEPAAADDVLSSPTSLLGATG